MALSGEEIRRRLREFAAAWGGYAGTERSEAQTFLNALLDCYGTDRREVGARFEERVEGGFMDLFWPGVCIIEMKRPSEAGRLPDHREQMLRYWQASGTPASPAPRYVVLCAFHRFEVWEPGAVYTEPRIAFDLVELPDHLDALLFLAGRQPVFIHDETEVTREAVSLVTDVYRMLRERRAADLDVLRDFILQSVWAMFAEDLAMLPSHLFTRVLDGLLAEPARSSRDDLGQLFAYLNEPRDRPTEGIYAGTPYANGSLFARPARVHLDRNELELLRQACESNWRKVEPAIFGALLQGALGKERQWALGAHYTAEADILKIVLPTIVEPWRERIAACRTVADVQAAQDALMNYVVLDPACGSGNFLYVTYRELRRIEADLRRRMRDMRRSAGLREQAELALYFPLTNIKGIEIDPFAVQLARVTLWMGHKLAVDELDLEERVMPLVDLSGIRRGDALKLEWPRADAIIGNPPYHGDRFLRRELGDEYVEWLKREFGIGVKDYCVYWFRKAHDHLERGKRAGLVGTNSISQNRARGASLQYIIDNGGVITNAVSSQDWSGEAAVDVSIVNWFKGDAENLPSVTLDGRRVPSITAALRTPESDTSSAVRLAANAGRCFYGPIPAGKGFILDRERAERFLDSDPEYRDVIRPYLVGDDIAKAVLQRPSRHIIDFGLRSLEEATKYPEALNVVRLLVKPERDRTRRKAYRERWWRFAEPLVAMREAIEGLSRYVAGTAQGKRIHFCWVDPWTCPSNLVTVFAFEDDSAIGVLTSEVHLAWARAQGSTLEDRTRYTPQTSFGTFPWPTGDLADVGRVARRLYERRSEICAERQIGLTKLYNEVDEGAYRDLKELHDALDEAVAAAYGWPASAPTTRRSRTVDSSSSTAQSLRARSTTTPSASSPSIELHGLSPRTPLSLGTFGEAMSRRKRSRKQSQARRRDALPPLPPDETSVHVDTSDALTLDQFRELREEFFAGIPARLDILKAEVVDAMAEFDAFDVIANLLLANLPFDVESYRESEHEGLIALVEYAALLLLERPSRDGADPDRLRPMGAGEIRPLLDRLREMLALSSLLRAEEVTQRRDDTRALDDLRVRIVHREIFLRNPTYDWQETANLRSLFGSEVVSADLRATVGFDIDDALAFVEAVWRIGLDRFWERGQISRGIAKALGEDVRRVVRGEAPQHEDLSDLATVIASEPASARKRLVRNLAIGYAWTRAGDALQLTADDLASAAGRSLDAAGAFLEFFSITFGAVAGTTAFTGSHPLRTHPVIRDADGHYMCTYHGNILYALRSRLEERLKPQGGEAGSTRRWERYNRARRTFAEERAVSLLRAGLKTETAWLNPKYSIDGGDLVELDGLVLVDTVLLVLEAKGSALSPPARRALPPRLKRDVEEVLAAAALQAGRLTSAIEDRRTLTFVDSEGNAISLETDALSRAFPIVVSLDDFSGLSTSLWSLAEAELLNVPQPLPWVVSLDELEIVLDLLDYAAQLPHFLMRRRLINESKAVRASDELDFFVFYLLRGLYFEDVLAQEDGPDHIFLQSMTDDVDAYYLWKRGHRKSKARKPSMKFDPLTRKFMAQLDTERPPGFVEASIALLEMSGETRAQFSRHTRRLVAQSARDGSFHDFTLSFVPDNGWGVTVVTSPRARLEDVPTRLTPHVVLKKHQLGADVWIGFGVVAGAKKTFQALVVDYTPWRPDAELDEGVAQFFRDVPPVDQLSAKKRQALERENR